MLKLSNEQLTKLTLHTAAINSLLAEALLGMPEPEKEYGQRSAQDEMQVDVFVIGADREGGRPQAAPLDLDALCGEWKGGRKKPGLLIFKAEPGYMAAWGKKPKDGETGDCYLIHEAAGKLCVSMGSGFVFLSFDESKDTITLYPGGEYTRVTDVKK